MFIEPSPHPVLVPGIEETAFGLARNVLAIGTLRRDEGGWDQLLQSVARAWVDGVQIDWTGVFGGAGNRVELPTYPFQHTRYWPEFSATTGDVTSAGLLDMAHPLLGAGVPFADSDGFLFTARLSLSRQPWLADHTLMGMVVVPGAAIVEMSIRAGDQVGCPRIEELTLEAPIVVPESGGITLQLRLDGPDAAGARQLAIYSQAEDGGTWQRHATCVLVAEQPLVPDEFQPVDGEWPPAGAITLDAEHLYERFADSGYDYGPVFRGLTAAWRRGDEMFAEVRLPSANHTQSAAFGIHPALLDAALHASWLEAANGDGDTAAAMPFYWSDVRLHSAAATALRVRLAPSAQGGVQVLLADPTGAPVGSVNSLVARPVSTAQLQGNRTADSLFVVDWPELPPAPAAEGDLAVVRLDPMPREDVTTVREAVLRALDVVRARLADEVSDDRPLVLVTRRAVGTDDEDVLDLAGAAVWGLVRSAQVEHPGRFVLVDTDGHASSDRVLAGAVATGEPQLALRDGTVRAPRLARAGTDEQDTQWDPAGTMLITGAGGALGTAVTRHLAATHKVRSLVLVGRSGPASQESRDLMAELTALGVDVSFVACDVADRLALADVIASIPADRPLTGVVHCAGVIDDGPLMGLSAEQIDRTLRPKVDGALHLHELTRHLDLSVFALFSSASSTTGSIGQAGYTAGNAFLDALAQRRRAQGLPAQSLGWGLWARRGAMTGGLGAAQLSRSYRDGVAELSDTEGLALFDAALARPDRALLLPLRIDPRRIRPEEAPPLLRGLVRSPVRRTAGGAVPADAGTALRRRLAALDADSAADALDEVVRTQVAIVLGHAGPEAIDPERAFKDTGFDSLTAVELRNRLSTATGLRLPPTLVFDYPTPAALANHLTGRLAPATNGRADHHPSAESRSGAEVSDSTVRDLLRAIPLDRLRTSGLLDGLLRLATPNDTADSAGPRLAGADLPPDLSVMGVGDLVRMALGGTGPPANDK